MDAVIEFIGSALGLVMRVIDLITGRRSNLEDEIESDKRKN